jgi:putative tricarboxylic transport membrane protein
MRGRTLMFGEALRDATALGRTTAAPAITLSQGRAGPALATATLGSFFAGTVATVLLVLAAPPLADVALASGSLLKAFTMIVLGLLLGLVGRDVETGTQRFTFDMPEVVDGLNFVALSMAVFGLGEILRNLEHEHTRFVMVKHVSGLMSSKSRTSLCRSLRPTSRAHTS